ncbi:hypothetical protein, partial [Parvibaculum sp.]|uniref:hypothetical protein n=1 Tax=Parvibaculum sp. TaxID=2024848 RepID=UPI003C708702
VLVRIWREIMVAMTRIQGPFRVDVSGGRGTDAIRFWDLARNYYGSTTPMELHEEPREVVRRVGSDRAAIGILPEPTAGNWWMALASGSTGNVRIVARLPFVEVEKEDGSLRALVLGHSEFEKTGDDTSLIALSVSESLSDARVTSLLRAAGLEGRRIASARFDNGAGAHVYLMEVPHHLAEDDERLAALAVAPVAEVRLLGGYANPLRLQRDGE